MLRSLPRALSPSLLAAARPGCAVGGLRAFGGVRAGDPFRNDERAGGARQAAEDFMSAAQDSVRHAVEGNPAAVVQDTARMAASAAQGAFESAKVLADTLGFGTMVPGAGGQGRSETSKAFERVSSAVSDASGQVGSAVTGAAATMTNQAGVGMQQARASLAGSTPQATGPESTWGGHVFRSEHTESGSGGAGGEGVPSPAASSPEELKERALGEHWSGTPSETGSGAQGTITKDTTAGVGPDVSSLQPGEGEGEGLGGAGPGGRPRVSERSFNEDEFGVTREEGERK